MVGDHEADVEVQLAAPRAPQEVQQAVVVAADHDRHALGHAGVGERPLHAETAADLRGEASLDLLARRRQARAMKDHPQEEHAALGIGRVLAGLDDVRAELVQEARHGGDDPGPVGAGHQQPAHVRGAAGSRHGCDSTFAPAKIAAMSTDTAAARPRRMAPAMRQQETVTPLELFFDLVFVLALTQCTALMADEPTWEGLAKGHPRAGRAVVVVGRLRLADERHRPRGGRRPARDLRGDGGDARRRRCACPRRSATPALIFAIAYAFVRICAHRAVRAQQPR